MYIIKEYTSSGHVSTTSIAYEYNQSDKTLVLPSGFLYKAFYDSGSNPDLIDLRPHENIPNVISCDGATTSAYFPNGIPDNDYTWTFELDGVPYQLAPNAIISNFYFPTELRAEINADGDGDTIISNKSYDTEHRVRLIPNPSIDPSEIIFSSNNPTISVDENGVISFCLATLRA